MSKVQKVDLPTMTGGLDKSKKEELLDLDRFVDCDGFTVYHKVVRKEFALVDPTVVYDVIKKRTTAQLRKCCTDCPEGGNTTEGGSGGGW